MTPPSGASNRQKQRAAEAGRRAEEQLAPRRLAHLPPEQAAEARATMDAILLGALTDPDAAPDDEEEPPDEP